MTYYLALIKGTGQVRCWANGHRSSTVVLQARRDVDYLSPDIWKFLGPRVTTKKQLTANKHGILTWINGYFDQAFTTIIVD